MAIDYRSFQKNGEIEADSAVPKDWWKLKDAQDRSNSIAAVLKQIQEQDRARQYQYNISQKLYGNIDLMALNGLTLSRVQPASGMTRDRMSYNVVQSATDTVTAKIAKNKPKPLFLTSGGDYKIQRRAKKLDKFVDGVFYENNAYQLGTDIFRDGAVNGDGLVHVFELNGRVKYERVLAGEVKVDWVESFNNDPRQMHRVKLCDRGVLKDHFPDHAKEIDEASNIGEDLSATLQNVSDQVIVAESWRLPSGVGATDGLHTICILGGAELYCEKWKKQFFPFARFSWAKRINSYWSQGLAEQIQNIQLELNKILWVEQRAFHVAGALKVLVENGSKVVKEHINNEIGTLIYYQGTKPEYVIPPVMPVGFNERKQFLISAAFEQAGVSQLSAAAQKPAGLDSGKALRTMNNIESERFMTIGQAYEDFYLQLAKLTVDCARDIAKSGKKIDVRTPNNRFIETINWNECSLEDQDMILKIYPVSSLPTDPSGRLAAIQEQVQAGWITPRTAKRLMDFPDLEMAQELQNSKEDYLHMLFEKMIDDGEFVSPEPFDDLQLAKELFLEYYALSKMQGVEEEKLELLRQFDSQVSVLIQKAMPPMPAPMMGAPQANPAQAPQSDLINNVPVGV